MQAALDIWVMILRFMGDLPEPKEEVKESKSLAKKLSGSISRRFKKEDLTDFVRVCVCVCVCVCDFVQCMQCMFYV